MEIGDVLGGRFEIAQPAGAGGMGVVYLAHDRYTGSEVAIKVARASRRETDERFRREARIIERLVHPAIVRYIDHGETPAKERYIVTEWLEGVSLSKLQGTGAFEWKPSVRAAIRLADGVRHAHGIQIVHRDIKPTNIFAVDSDFERLKLLDFGIARSMDAETRLTDDGQVLGTIGFMAPEQARGSTTVDARADLYSLGAVLYKMISGHRPIAATGLRYLEQVQIEVPPRLRSRVPEIPPVLDDLVARLLAVDPDARPADAAEVASQLREIDRLASGRPFSMRQNRSSGSLRAVPAPRPLAFVARENELALLLRSLDEVTRARRAQAVVIEGPRGSGRSRLAMEFVDSLARSPAPHQVISARAEPTGALAPYGLAAAIVKAACDIQGRESREEQCRRIEVHLASNVPIEQRARLAEVLGVVIGLSPSPTESEALRLARADPAMMFDEIRAAWIAFLTAEVLDVPTVIVVDDAEKADAASLALLGAALRALAAERLLIVALASSGFAHVQWDSWSIDARPAATLAPLDPLDLVNALRRSHPHLSVDEARDIVARCGGVAARVARLALPDADRDEITAVDVDDTINLPSHPPLDAVALEVGAAASVGGLEFERVHLVAVVGDRHSPQAFSAAIEDLEREGILEPSGAPGRRGTAGLRFCDPSKQASVLAGLSSETRQSLHRGWATALSRDGERHAAVIADHYERGVDSHAAATWFLVAARQAASARDFASASDLARRGAKLTEPDDALRARLLAFDGEMRRWLGDPAGAESASRMALVQLAANTREWFRAVYEFGDAASRLGHMDDALEAASRLERAEPHAEDVHVYIDAAAGLVQPVLAAGYVAEADRLLETIERRAAGVERLEPRVAARLRRVRGYRSLMDGDIGAYLRETEAARVGFEFAGARTDACMLRGAVGYANAIAGCYEEAEWCLLTALAELSDAGLHALLPLPMHVLGLVLGRTRRRDEGLSLIENALDAATKNGDRRVALSARYYLAVLLRDAGRLAEAEAALVPLMSAPNTTQRALARAEKARILLDRGDPAAALVEAEEAYAILERAGGVETGESTIRLAYAQALARADRVAEADAAADDAARRLIARAGRISDERIRRCFLENVPENAETLRLAAERTSPRRRGVT